MMKKLTLIIILCIGAYLYYSNKVKAELTTSKQVENKVEERCGIKFFQNIHPNIAKEVKTQKNIADWSAFK